MSKLSAFLNPIKTSIEKEVIISDRFVDESGQLVPFKIRALTQEENDALIRAATTTEIVNGVAVEHLDSVDYARRTIVAATIDPDFSAKETCDRFGTPDPKLVPGRMLFTGEYNRLMKEISALNQMDGKLVQAEVKN